MEIDDMLSDLISLRKLYGLLQTNKDGQQIANFKNLDDKARNLLKKLLDDAAVKIFETHSKTVATPAIEHNTPCATQPWQPKPMPKVRPVSPGISKNFPNVAENHIKGFNPSTDFLQKDELSAASPVPQDTISELSRHSASINKAALRRKRGWVQSQSNFTHPNSAKVMKLRGWKRRSCIDNSSSVDRFQLSRFNWDNGQPEGSESREKCMDFEKNQKYSREPDSKTHQNRSSVKPFRCSSSKLAAEAIQSGETVVKVEAGDIPKEAAKPIMEQIESHLSSVQLGDSTMVAPVSRGQGPNPFLLGKKSVIKEGEKTQEGWSHHPSPIGNAMVGHEHCQKCGKKKSFKLRGQTQSEVPASLPSQNESWIPSHNLRETMDSNIQQMSTSLNQNDDYSIVNGLRFLHTQTGKVNQVLGGMDLKGPNRMAVASQPAAPCSSGDSGDNISRRHTKALHRGGGPSWTKTKEAASGETVQGSPQLDNHRPNKISTPPITYKEAGAAGERRGSYKHSKMGRQKQGPPSRHAWGTSRSSNGSSSWESQAWSTSGGSNSELYSRSSWQSSSSSGNSNSESYSDTYSSWASEGKNDSSSSEVVEEHSRSRRMESQLVAPGARSVVREENKLHLRGTTNKKKTNKPEKGIGRFKKFKDKLALIFHHHHHHHHHHHRSDDNDDREGSRDTAGRTDGNNQVYEEQVVEEVRRRAVGRKTGRRRQGQLQALVGGLVKHVRKSKKPKRDKAGGIGQQLGNARGHRKLGKKIKWWQKLRPPGGRVKLSSGKGKSHVKFGFKKGKNKKPP